MKIIIHGGFFSESSTNQETKIAKQEALLRIVKQSYAYLQTHTALETVVYAVSMLEDDVDIMIPTETYVHVPEVPESESNIQSAEPRFYETLEIDLIGTLQESLGVDQLIQLLLGLYKKAEEIITALESQDIIDPDFTRARAHEMKGMAGNFGFQKLSDQARNIEKIVKTGSIEGVQEMILELNPIYQQSRADLDHWLGSKSSK